MKWMAVVGLALCLAVSSSAWGAEGLIAVRSPRTVAMTMDRLEAVAKQGGMTIVARIDHAAGAATVGMTLRPTALLIFGHPKGGTPFIACEQTVGIDLPLKALVWEDGSGGVWVGYNDPAFIAARHEVPACGAASAIGTALAGLVARAVAP
jgi:uncharacterized protein (DUF302 family)